MSVFTLTPRGPFSLSASVRFLEGFAPARYRGGAAGEGLGQPLRLAFPVEGDWRTAGVSVTQRDDGTVVTTCEKPCPPGVREQLARILSLDIDGSGFAAVGERDPVVARLAERYPGLRPVCFHSPYEAACWAVIGHRIRIIQAAGIKERIARDHGERRLVNGVELFAFPGPEALLAALDGIDLPPVKLERLRGIATAALDGRLEAARLRNMAEPDAQAELQRLDGVGPFSSELILVRGAGAPDVFPATERRLRESMVELYDLADASPQRLAEVAARWSPYRSWVGVLIRTYREDTTGEIGGQQSP
ncbi:MAG: DNA-3-methyladenine glycosylase family protein [Streptosporangiales bacterium]